jgi:RecG-like helicase
MKLTDIKGIGQKTLEILKTQGITDIPSLLYTIPKNYTEYKITPFMYEGEMNVEALVTEEVHLQKLKNATKVSFRVAIEGIPMNVVMFNMVYLKNVLKVGMEIVIVGTYDKDYKTINATKIFKKEENL